MRTRRLFAVAAALLVGAALHLPSVASASSDGGDDCRSSGANGGWWSLPGDDAVPERRWYLNCVGGCPDGTGPCSQRYSTDAIGAFWACLCSNDGTPDPCCQLIVRPGVGGQHVLDTYGDCPSCPLPGFCSVKETAVGGGGEIDRKGEAGCVEDDGDADGDADGGSDSEGE